MNHIENLGKGDSDLNDHASVSHGVFQDARRVQDF